MPTRPIPRRLLLAAPLLPALPLLQGCAAPLPPLSRPESASAAQALLAESAAAHGQAALSGLRDVSISYSGEWRLLVARLQPVLVDAGFRGGSEERLLLREGIVAQAHIGPSGRKQVVRQTTPGAQGGVRVWLNGEEASDRDRRAAAALVADGYLLFLLGPMLLAGRWASERTLTMELAGTEWVTVDGQRHPCDVLRFRMVPGFGLSDADDLALYIDRPERLMRRVRFTLNALESTRGALAEVDAWGHVTRNGVRWPTRFHEHLLRPGLLPVHDWRLTGLDLDRGLTVADVTGPSFVDRAAAPAAPL